MNEKSRLGHEFIQKLRTKSNDAESFKAVLKEFAEASLENRVAVAMSLLAIGADESERLFDRNDALAQLGMFTRTCGLRNNKGLKQRLDDIIDVWLSKYQNGTLQDRDGCSPISTGSHVVPWGALWALGAVNRQFGLEKCDIVIKHYWNRNAERQLQAIREGIERLNPSES